MKVGNYVCYSVQSGENIATIGYVQSIDKHSGNFYVVWFNPKNKNWAGVAFVPRKERKKYCNFKIIDNEVSKIVDKRVCDDTHRAFTGFLFIKDHKIFWKGLNSKKKIGGEIQISNGLTSLLYQSQISSIEGEWKDMGNKENYQKELSKIQSYDFGKKGEAIYFVNNKVVKYFQDIDIVRNRVKKVSYNKKVFPKISDQHEQFYAYKFLKGETMYAQNNPALFKKFLIWLDKYLWRKIDIQKDFMNDLCMKFYHDKTAKRLSLFNKNHKTFKDPKIINDNQVFKIDNILKKIDWINISNGTAVFMHGDLQLDNVVYNKDDKKFSLLDWRQDFSGQVKFGDIYYDLAKLKGGLIVNYDYIKMNLLYYQNDLNNVNVDFARRANSETYMELLDKYILENGYDIEKVNTIVGLIFLNMAPLHHPPFDEALYCLSALQLSREIITKNKYFIT